MKNQTIGTIVIISAFLLMIGSPLWNAYNILNYLHSAILGILGIMSGIIIVFIGRKLGLDNEKQKENEKQ